MPTIEWNEFYPKADGNNFSANLQTTSNNQVGLDKKHFEVDRYILAEALSNVEELGLMQTELGKDQVDSLLGQIFKKQNTKEVNLYEVNLADVDKSLLSEAVTTYKF